MSPWVLEIKKNSNFSKWSSFFRSCAVNSASCHTSTGCSPYNRRIPPSRWPTICVCSWIYGSASDHVLDLDRGATDPTTRELWVAIDNLFEANNGTRLLVLSS